MKIISLVIIIDRMALRNEKEEPFIVEMGSVAYPEIQITFIPTGKVVHPPASPQPLIQHANQPYQNQVYANNNKPAIYQAPISQPNFNNVTPVPPGPITNQNYSQNNPNQAYQSNNLPNYQNQRPNQQPNNLNYQYQQNQQNYQYQQNYQNFQDPQLIVQDRTIVIQESSRNACMRCGFVGKKLTRERVGAVTWAWSCCLFWFTGIIGFWIPFVVRNCKDIELVCPSCLTIDSVLPATCC